MIKRLNFCKVREVKSIERGTDLSAGIDCFIPKFNDKFIKDLLKFNNKDIKKLAIEKTNNKILKVLLKSKFFQSIYFENNTIIINNLLNTNMKCIILKPNEPILIPLGIKIDVLQNYSLNVYNKSGIASKKGLIKLAEVIDEDYTGEIFLSLVNITNNIVIIEENEKIVQLLLQPILYTEIQELENADILFKDKVTDRGEGSLGSTNKEEK